MPILHNNPPEMVKIFTTTAFILILQLASYAQERIVKVIPKDSIEIYFINATFNQHDAKNPAAVSTHFISDLDTANSFQLSGSSATFFTENWKGIPAKEFVVFNYSYIIYITSKGKVIDKLRIDPMNKIVLSGSRVFRYQTDPSETLTKTPINSIVMNSAAPMGFVYDVLKISSRTLEIRDDEGAVFHRHIVPNRSALGSLIKKYIQQ